ncbi:MAG: hypothetical protein ACPLLR_07485 [Methanothrix sp.]|uniref:hypothetical protein n=1 Tax=Methanothrix sp. TaxID=90426 RepID=UPI003C713561
MIQMILAGMLLVLLLLGLLLHRWNLERIYRRLSELSSGVSRDELYQKIAIDHGANFSAMVFSSWVAFFVAFAYYLLPPSIPLLLRFGFLIAESYGLAIFAISVTVLASVLILASRGFPVWLRLSDIYSIYPMPLNQKKLCFVPVMLLWVSSWFSIYNSISYPYVNWMLEVLAGLLLLLALILLFIPVFKEVGR